MPAGRADGLLSVAGALLTGGVFSLSVAEGVFSFLSDTTPVLSFSPNAVSFEALAGRPELLQDVLNTSNPAITMTRATFFILGCLGNRWRVIPDKGITFPGLMKLVADKH